jgi:hypothetical protein
MRKVAALALATALAAGCSWHRHGEANAVAAAEGGLPQPAEGMSIAEVVALAEVEESGDLSADAEVLRVAKISGGIWEDVSIRTARRADFAPAQDADYVVVANRTCSDWTGRERWSDDRASWFLLPGGRLAAWDHWTFGARCGLSNDLRPVAEGSPSRTNERDLLRWLEQRHPPGRIPTELRIQRGRAFAAAGRLAEARAMLRYADDALLSREDLFESRETTEEERAAFEAEGKRLRDLRADLSSEVRAAEARAAEAEAKQ